MDTQGFAKGEFDKKKQKLNSHLVQSGLVKLEKDATSAELYMNSSGGSSLSQKLFNSFIIEANESSSIGSFT